MSNKIAPADILAVVSRPAYVREEPTVPCGMDFVGVPRHFVLRDGFVMMDSTKEQRPAHVPSGAGIRENVPGRARRRRVKTQTVQHHHALRGKWYFETPILRDFATSHIKKSIASGVQESADFDPSDLTFVRRQQHLAGIHSFRAIK